jgi:hypothetical protein
MAHTLTDEFGLSIVMQRHRSKLSLVFAARAVVSRQRAMVVAILLLARLGET